VPIRRRSANIPGRFLVIDVSNSYTKFAVASGGKLGRVRRIPTSEASARRFADETANLRFERAVLCSVVPARNRAVHRALRVPVLEISPALDLGISISYPDPASIGSDRLANTAACVAIHGSPAIVVDFGTAVTFDVITGEGCYAGGVIAPGLGAMSEYLHRRTALLPLIALAEPPRAVGQSTREAMLSGAVHGYRGLVREILSQIRKEAFPRRRPLVVATGGDAALIAGNLPLFDVIAPHLTLEGIRLIGERNFCGESRGRGA